MPNFGKIIIVLINQNSNLKQNSLWWSKVTINCIIQLVVFILWILSVYYSSVSFKTYGWEYVVDPSFVLPSNDAATRMFLIFLTTIFVFQSFYNIYFCLKLKNIKGTWLVYSGGMITWLFLPLLIYEGFSKNYFNIFKQHISTERHEGLQISNRHVYDTIKYGYRKDKLFSNTLLAYFTFICTLVGFILIWIPKNSYTGLSFFSFEVFVYFTQLTNLSCFFFMLLFLVFHRKIAFKQNVIISYIAAYIAIVGVVFWSALLPFYNNKSSYISNSLRLTTTIWLHAITPIIFVVFTIRSFVTNYAQPKDNVWLYLFKGCIYPAFYSIFAYLLPFTIHFSVYGPITNLNEQMFNEKGVQMGYWWMIFVALFAVFLFIGTILLFRKINKSCVKNHQAFARALADQNSFSNAVKDH